jgi:hypothetical protein
VTPSHTRLRRRRAGAASAGLVAIAWSASIGAQSTLSDFARGAQIRLSGQGPVVRVVLPEAVYTTVTRQDLADIGVFNSAGEPVPHTLRHAPAPEATATVFVGVPFFPLRQTAPNENLLTQVAVGASGAIVEVRGGPPPGEETVGYLLDATTVKVPVDRLSLEWETAEGTRFLARVAVEASSDLNIWRTVAPDAAIAHLEYGDRNLKQADIDLPGGEVRYLRISWPRPLANVRLTGARLRPQSAVPVPEVTWTTRTGRVVAPAGVAEYDTGGRLPVEYVDIEFADDADVASVVVRSRPSADVEWRRVYDGAFFSVVRDGTRVRNPPVNVALNTDRHWQLETSYPGGWAQARAPRIRLGWHAHELLFVPKGAPPFTLAFGSGTASGAAAPIGALLAGLGTGDALARPEPATLDAPRDLAGSAVLTPPRSLRQFALWGVLVAAVLALGALVARAARDMKRS